MRASPKPLILVVEDEPELAKIISIHLEEAGMQCQHYDRAALAASLKRNVRPETPSWPEAEQLADYVMAAWAHAAGAAPGMFADGSFRFERPEMLEPAK